MNIDLTAASNPLAVVNGVMRAFAPALFAEDLTPASPQQPAIASKCPECGLTMLRADGCQYCNPKGGDIETIQTTPAPSCPAE